VKTDESFALLTQGYRYSIGRRSGSVHRTRLMGRPAVLVGGPAGVRLFYDESRIQRSGAIPVALKNTLFGKGAVHGLDDQEHRDRKAMFVGLLTPETALEVASRAEREWIAALRDWREGTTISVFDTAVLVHGRAVCDWAGIPDDDVTDAVLHDLITMVDGFGTVGPRFVAAWRARRRADRWATAVVERVRHDRRLAPAGSALATFAFGPDGGGQVLAPRVAAVELLNVLRPTVAVAYFVAFAVDALDRYPTVRGDCATGEAQVLESFAHEVRRYYPFVPLLGGKARRNFDVDGGHVRKGTRVLLDVRGTLQQADLWAKPDDFDLHRFDGDEPDPWTFIPQGGGDVATGHRCPGERIAIELIKTATRTFSSASYDVPPQDREIPMSRIPTKPKSGLVVRRVGRAQP
jgi:fatty-acid peroxygenase